MVKLIWKIIKAVFYLLTGIIGFCIMYCYAEPYIVYQFGVTGAYIGMCITVFIIALYGTVVLLMEIQE